MADSQPNRRTSPTLDVVQRDNNHLLLSFGNVMLVLWYGNQEPRTCSALYDSTVTLAAQTGTGKVAALSIVLPGTTPPSPQAREALRRLHDDPDHIIYRTAVVFPNDGFIASIIRSIALSVMQGASRRHGHDVFQRVDKALAWVTEGLPTTTGLPIPTATLLHLLAPHLGMKSAKVA